MDKRLPLFLFLAFLILFAWRLIFPPPPDVVLPARPEAAQSGNAEAPIPSGDSGELRSVPASATPAVAETSERELVLEVRESLAAGEHIRYRACFSNRGACLLSLDLADYVTHVGLDQAQRADPENWLRLVQPVEVEGQRTGSLLWKTSPSSSALAQGDLDRVLWQMEQLSAPENGVRFRYSPPGGAVVFEKTIAFEPGTWRLRLALTLENVAAGAGGPRSFLLFPARCVAAELGDQFYSEPTAVAIGRSADGEPYKSANKAAPGLREPGALEAPTPLSVVGLHNKYFAFLLREAVPAAQGQGSLGGASYRPVFESAARARALIDVEVSLNLALPAPAERRTFEYLVYAGPKDPGPFIADCAAHQLVIEDDLTVDSIAQGLLYVLRLFHRLVGNWGVAIILLTLCVRLVLFPLNRRSQTAMARYQKKMKRVQPRLEEAKKRFEGEPQKLREAQGRIMQEEGAFPPLGGCAPIFLQMPIFFGLFSALRTSFDLRQAPFFGWINDLSRPDRLLHIGLELPILPDIEYLNVLPILMVVLWVLQQMGMPKPADEQAARMQKMMLFMPVVFGFMLYNYAAGLSLYMMTTSGLSIVEQRVIKKMWPIDDTEPEKKAGPKKGCGPFSGLLQNMAEKHQAQLKRVHNMQAEKRRAQTKKHR